MKTINLRKYYRLTCRHKAYYPALQLVQGRSHQAAGGAAHHVVAMGGTAGNERRCAARSSAGMIASL